MGPGSRKRSFSRLVLTPVDVVLPGELWLGVARPHSCLRASVLGVPEVGWVYPGAKWNCCFLSLAYSHISPVRQSGPGGRARKGFNMRESFLKLIQNEKDNLRHEALTWCCETHRATLYVALNGSPGNQIIRRTQIKALNIFDPIVLS